MSGMMHSRPLMMEGSLIHISQSADWWGFGHFSSSSPLYILRFNTLKEKGGVCYVEKNGLGDGYRQSLVAIFHQKIQSLFLKFLQLTPI